MWRNWKEPVLAEDPTSGQSGQLPTYLAYVADGDVTAPLVYVNNGELEDYEQLDKMGISVKGASSSLATAADGAASRCSSLPITAPSVRSSTQTRKTMG